MCGSLWIMALPLMSIHFQPNVIIAYHNAYSPDNTFTLVDLRSCASKNINFSFQLANLGGSEPHNQVVFISGYSHHRAVMNAENFPPRLSPNAHHILYVDEAFLQVSIASPAYPLENIPTRRLIKLKGTETLRYADWISDRQILIGTSAIAQPMQFSLLTLPSNLDDEIINTPINCTIDYAMLSLRP
jgi:hypothetical protein